MPNWQPPIGERTRNSSADEIANMNFLRRHPTRTTKYKKEEKKQTVMRSLNNPQ